MATVQQKTKWIATGDFLFKYRNWVFPAILLVLFVGFKPTHNTFSALPISFNTDWVAIGLAVAGLLCRAAVIGFALIKHGGLNKQVYADHLITTGFFGVCRNPLYVGNMLLYAGIFLMHGNLYVVIIGTALYYAIYASIIAAEEHFLRGEFGEAYTDYCKTVPRWLPKLSRLAPATFGMEFSFNRILIKDYSPIANAIVTLLLLEIFESWHFSTSEQFDHDLKTYSVMIALLFLAAILISMAKKRKWLSL